MAHVQVPKQLANSGMASRSTKRPSSFPTGSLTFLSAATGEVAGHKKDGNPGTLFLGVPGPVLPVHRPCPVHID